ncbi:sigma factor-like helix-turn-helix DNA-binding protein [Streptomyces sp. NPDC026673]|uniref:sigma factor-like helix-turn-helix DNA-binding protein n=1 Tax=Streptomyces sp. NPDC026673 TaxID=3155724 RepID=UPI0033C6C8CE
MSAPSLETTTPTPTPVARSAEDGQDLAPEDLREAEAVFEDARRLMFGIAYRMLGSAGEAEEVLRDVRTRWRNGDRPGAQDAQASLVTMVTRLAIDALRSARARRGNYVGFWLPEPVATTGDPAVGAVNGEALEVAVLALMDGLTPTERAAYVLREAFGFPHARIAGIIGLSQADVRALVVRAREFLAEVPPGSGEG